MIVICCEHAADGDGGAAAVTGDVHISDTSRTSVVSRLMTVIATTAFWECANSENSASDTSCTYTTLTTRNNNYRLSLSL